MRYFTTIYVLLFSFILFAQKQVIVKGKISDLKTGKPLSEVYIIHKNNQLSTTDTKGNFQFKTQAGQIELTFRLIAYKTLTKKYFLKENDSLILNIQLQPTENQLSEIIISANRKAQRIADLTVSISMIKPEYILQNNLINANELINQVSGIEIIDGQASIRGGSGYSYGAGSRVLTLIDGLPILSADAGNIKWQFLPMENINSIEIIKGASSVLYGSSALNGIINFRTAEAKTTPSNKYSVQVGLYDKPQQKSWIWWDNPIFFQNISISHLKKYGNTDVVLSSAFQNNPGYRKLNKEQLFRFNAKIKHYSKKNPAINFGFALNSGYTTKTDFVLWENADNGALKQDTATASKLKGSFLTFDPFLSIRHNKFKHNLRIHLQYSNNSFTKNSQNNSQAISLYCEYQFLWNFNNKFNIISGISETNSKVISKFYNNHTGLNFAIFLQTEYNPIEKIKINGGLRFEYNAYDGVSDKLVPVFRAGLNYKAAQYTFIRASFGQAYRYPSIAEKFAATTLGAVKIFPNLEIRPETGWTSEIGIKQMLLIANWKAQADVSFFYSENTDMIEYLFGLFPDQKTGLMGLGFKAHNLENSRVYGIEPQLSVTKQLDKIKLILNFGYTYMYPVEFNKYSSKNSDVYLKYRSKHSFKANSIINYNKFQFGLNAFYKSKTLNIDNVFLNASTRELLLPGFYDYWQKNNTAYIIFDMNLAYKLKKTLRLSFSVKNLTNQEYMGRPGDIRPQRNYRLQLSGNF